MNRSTEIATATVRQTSRFDQEEEAGEHAEQTPLQTVTPVGTLISKVPPSLCLPPKPQYHISTTFHTELLLNDEKPDIVLISSDNVLFCVHKFFLRSASSNAFNGLLGVDATGAGTGTTAGSNWVAVPASSILFNVVLHAIYKVSCKWFDPPLEILLQAVGTLKTYGISIDEVVKYNTPLYDHIVAKTPEDPVEVFLVAAENNLDALAVTTSAHLHSLLLPQITDEMAKRMGPRYLKRLLKLHADRLNYLKQLLLDAPKPHARTLECKPADQRVLAQAWALAISNLACQVRPDMPASALQSAFGSLEELLHCDACKMALNVRVRQLILDWSMNAKSTISATSDDLEIVLPFSYLLSSNTLG
ncbi:hypothetical protein EIP91_010076, partial [Steccherinum ochraceum]